MEKSWLEIAPLAARWSSTFLVVERLLLVKAHLSSVLEELEWDNLATSEWKCLEIIKRLLQPFAQFTSHQWGGVHYIVFGDSHGY